MSIGDIAVQVKDPKAPELVPHKYCMTVYVSSIFSPFSFFPFETLLMAGYCKSIRL